MAQIPFSGKIKDDHGLDNLEFVYTITRLDGSGARIQYAHSTARDRHSGATYATTD